VCKSNNIDEAMKKIQSQQVHHCLCIYVYETMTTTTTLMDQGSRGMVKDLKAGVQFQLRTLRHPSLLSSA